MDVNKQRQAAVDMYQPMGLCDERGAAVVMTAKKLPDGSFGMVLLSVKGNTLYISDVDMKGNPGGIACEIPLKQVKDFKVCASFIKQVLLSTPVLQFVHQGFKYKFTNMMVVGHKKETLEIMRRETLRK